MINFDLQFPTKRTIIEKMSDNKRLADSDIPKSILEKVIRLSAKRFAELEMSLEYASTLYSAFIYDLYRQTDSKQNPIVKKGDLLNYYIEIGTLRQAIFDTATPLVKDSIFQRIRSLL
jgi:hypothetical protein